MSRSALALVAASLASALLWLALGTGGSLPAHRAGAEDWSGDFRSFYLPGAEYAAARWSSGEVPLWNPHQGVGSPFLATLQPGALYPPNALHLLLPVQPAFVALAALHVALAVFAAGALALGFGASRFGAAVSGVAFGVSVQVIGNIWSPPAQYAAAWTPVVWLAVDRLLAAPTGRRVAVLALGVAFQALSGWPYTLAMTLLSAAGYAALVGLARAARTRSVPWAPAAACGAGVAAGLMLAAPQLLPARELVAESCRAIGSLVSGQAVFIDEAHRVSVFWETLTSQGFNDTVPGFLVLALAIPAFLLPGPGRGRCLALLAVGLFFLAASFPYHTPVYDWLRELPLLGDFRFPFRYRMVLALGLAVAAGVGVTEIQRRLGRRGPAVAAVLLAGVVATSALPVLRAVPPFAREVPPAVSLAQELRDAGDVEPGPGLGRVYWAGRSDKLRAPAGSWAVHDLEPLFLARTAELVTFFDAGRPRTVMTPLPTAAESKRERVAVPFYGKLRLPSDDRRARILDLLSVTRVVADHPPGWLGRRYTRVSPPESSPVAFANPNARPRAYRATRAIAEAPRLETAARQLISDRFDPASDVLLEDPPPALRGARRVRPAPDGSDRVTVERYEPEHVVLSTSGSTPAVVVLTDAWFPGWEATVDGTPAAIHRANLLFRGVAVPAGEHRIEMRYRPASFRLGVLLAVSTLLALAFAARPGRS